MSAKFVARIGAAVAVALIAVGSIGLAGQMAGAAPAKGSIAGTVRDAVTGEPVSGVSVDVFYLATNGAPGGGTVQGPGFLAGTQTAADGTYKVSGLAPSDANGYWVCFDTGLFGPYEFECWVDQSTFFYPFPDPFGFFQLPSASRTVHLGAGQHVTGIDGDLIAPAAPGSPPTTGSVGGRVTAKGTNSGVSDVTVTAFNSAGLPVGHAVTALHGAYEIANLAPSSYTICVDGANARLGATPAAFHGRCYPSARWREGMPPPTDAMPVSVTVGMTTPRVNVALPPGSGG
jgi:hypothetical protein